MALTILGYSFEGPFQNTSSLKSLSGVYVIVTKNRDGDYNVVDVGQSGSVRERIENHDRADCWEKHKQNGLYIFVHYTPSLNEAQRCAIESKIRDAYNPPCGKI